MKKVLGGWTLVLTWVMAVAACSQAATPLATQVTLGGYIKLDALFSQTQYGQLAFPGRDFYVPSLTPVSGAKGELTFDSHGRQSRFFMATHSQLDNGETITGRIELDTMSTAGGDERITNSYTPRVRHAYFIYGKWLFGQTWTSFMDTNAFPETVEFIGNSDGAVFARQAQLRYSSGNFQLGLENAQTTITPYGGGSRITPDTNRLPDLVLRYNLNPGRAQLSIAALGRELAYNSASQQDYSLGYGLSLSGKYTLANRDDLRFTLNGGRGIGRYLGQNSANDAVLTSAAADAQLEAIDARGYALAYRHLWADKWRSSLIYSAFAADNPPLLSGVETTKSTRSGALNLVYQASPKLLFGGELRYARRALASGAEGDLKRLQFTARYDF